MGVTSQADIKADAGAVWAVLVNAAGLGDWVTNHLGFSGQAPTELQQGDEYTEKMRVLGMPNEVRWTVTELAAGERMVQRGKGPMGISIRGEYSVQPADVGVRVTLDQSFSGAAVFAIKGQLEREVKEIQVASLEKLRALVEAG